MNHYVEKLEQIAEVHLNRHPAHIVDSKALTLDMEKMLSHVIGPEVLEGGHQVSRRPNHWPRSHR